MRLLPVLLAIAALVTGCGDDESTTSEPRVPGPTDTLVVYERTGGIAGIRERLAVRPDGAARLETGYPNGPGFEVKRVKLSAGELDGLRAALAAVDFADLESRYGPEQPVADGFATGVTAQGREVTVLTEGEPPPELQRLIAVCAGLVEVHARR